MVDLSDAFFAMPIWKDYQKQFPLIWQNQE